MKQCFLILTILFALTACNKNTSNSNDQVQDSLATKAISDTLKGNENTEEQMSVKDSLILYDDSLFVDLKPALKEISKNEFQSYKKKYKVGCVLDSGNFISGSGLYVDHSCNEICETYLVEKATNRRMLMPSAYDAGILSMQLSPSCNQLIVCASYDGPDYENYYENRAEIMGFNVTAGNGLNGIKPAFKYYTKDWSIDDLTWISDKSIALKMYEEPRQGDGSRNHYKYFKITL